jgi:hypothetical protein
MVTLAFMTCKRDYGGAYGGIHLACVHLAVGFVLVRLAGIWLQ